MNQLWLFLCGIALFYGFIAGKTDLINQTLLQTGQDAFDFALPVLLTTCFFGGLMEIAKQCGILNGFQKLLSPFLKRLFSDVPEDHPALLYISANIVINMFGLGFAATPSGLNAMKHLQELNGKKEEASRSMVTFLVLNTAGVTILSTNILAYRIAYESLNPVSYLPFALISTICASIAGLLLDRWWNYH